MSTEKPKTKRGGARAGSGRKPRTEPKEALTIRVEPEIAERFREICKAADKSQPAQLTEWVKKSR